MYDIDKPKQLKLLRAKMSVRIIYDNDTYYYYRTKYSKRHALTLKCFNMLTLSVHYEMLNICFLLIISLKILPVTNAGLPAAHQKVGDK